MTARKVRWALVGAGDLARKRLAAAIRSQPGSILRSLVSRDPEGRAPDLRTLSPEAVQVRFEEMLEDDSVDAVYLATPVFLHAPQAIAALKAGKDVLVEKPMAMDLRQAREMCRVARDRGRRLSVAYYRRFWPRFQLVKEMLDRGELGELVLIRIALHSWYPGRGGEAADWRITPSLSGGGVLSDVGCHRLDLLAWWLGPPGKLVSRVLTLTHGYSAEDSVTALLEWEGGPAGTVSFNWNSRTWTDEIHLVGTDAKITLHPCDGETVTITAGRDIRQRSVPNPENAHGPVVDEFARSILEDRPPRFDGPEGLQATRIMDAVFRSARQGAWTELD